MIRNILLAAAVALVVTGCSKPADKDVAPPGSEPQTEGAPAPAAPAAAPHDWHFMAHGGSADLDFGDGDWAEGQSDFHFSCLPNSKSVEMSLAKDGKATLTSGGQSVTVEADSSASTDEAALKAFRASGMLNVSQGSGLETYNGSAAGKAEVEKFFAYCNSPAA